MVRPKIERTDILGEYTSSQWNSFSVHKKRLLILEAMLTGEWIRPKITEEASHRLPHDVKGVLDYFEEIGTIAGYTPVLSQKGQQYLESLRVVVAQEDAE